MQYETLRSETARLKIAYHRVGRHGQPKLLLVHGDCSSSLFFLPLMQRLEDRFDMIALDLRCFGETDPLPIDATRGLRDYSDDVDAFVRAIGWERFSLLGWSMGGGVAMQYAIDHAEKLQRVILVAPMSPFGYGGSYDEDGKTFEPVGLCAGAGTVTPLLLNALRYNDRSFASHSISQTYVRTDYRIPADRMELFVSGFLSTKLGDGRYPGDVAPAAIWPFVATGMSGVNNAMSPKYCNLAAFAEIPEKPPVLWVRGDADVVICDNSICDMAYLGKIGIVPGYPGEIFYPPQPMLRQTHYVMDRYIENGGRVDEVVLHSGHGPFLDNEDAFIEVLLHFWEKTEERRERRRWFA